MISLYANGGLGNQLFNYAAARTLADRTSTGLVVDGSTYRDQWGPDATRPHILHRFPVRAVFRNLEPSTPRGSLVRRISRRVREDLFSRVLFRSGGEIGYFPGFRHLGGRTILKGHFISPKFFAENEDRIRRDLTLESGIVTGDEEAIRLFNSIRGNENAVGVHVRRGDLLSPELDWLLLPGIVEYYRQAIDRMVDRLGSPVFWVFSDDPAWCRAAFAEYPADIRFVDTLSDSRVNPVKEFFLMCQCRNFIIANSAFSWWAAWLGSHARKHVMAPYKWDNRALVSVMDLVPAEWERIAW